MTYECINYILKYIESNGIYVKYYKTAHIPDEMFFHTIVLNSSFEKNVENDDLRYIYWIKKTTLFSHFRRRKKSSTPAILGEADFNNLMQSEKLFARKFDINYDSSILKMIDNEILIKSNKI